MSRRALQHTPPMKDFPFSPTPDQIQAARRRILAFLRRQDGGELIIGGSLSSNKPYRRLRKGIHYKGHLGKTDAEQQVTIEMALEQLVTEHRDVTYVPATGVLRLVCPPAPRRQRKDKYAVTRRPVMVGAPRHG